MARAYYFNLRGTSKRKCKCGSWIDHYYNNTPAGAGGDKCAVLGCGNEAEVGAHVSTRDGRSDTGHYIVPMCRPCNNDYENEFQLKSNIQPVTANRTYSNCGRG